MGGWFLTVALASAASRPEVSVGERLFSDVRFARPLVSEAGDGTRRQPTSCRTCHFTEGSTGTFGDRAPRSLLPARDDGRSTTPRNSPALVDALLEAQPAPLLHYDGEFATATELVSETFLGRNFGWLPGERDAARQHFARVIREDGGAKPSAPAGAPLPLAVLLRGSDPAIPAAWRLPAALRVDPDRATDEEILRGCAELVVAFMQSLTFSRDATGAHDGSPYDAFLAANRLPRMPRNGETPPEYARRLRELAAALRVPRFVDEPARRLRQHDQPFRFGEAEFEGMKIFFREAVGSAQRSGAGNCAECHVPPLFTDLKFHNTGVAQDDYDGVHGSGAFAALRVPSLAERTAEPRRWLPPTPQHPDAAGPWLSIPSRERPGHTDLGLWNIYGNPDFPAPQAGIARLLDATGRSTADAVLAKSLARFKTATTRDLGHSAPYLHTGHLRTVREVVEFYRRMSALAGEGKLRNAPPEFFAMRLGEPDIDPLTAFLCALNEDYEWTGG